MTDPDAPSALPVGIYDLAARCLHAETVAAKLVATQCAAELFRRGAIIWDAGEEPASIGAVRFPPRPQEVEPRGLPRRSLGSEAGRAALLHAVAHIEFTAIHLAWDILYRFRAMPDAFRADWLGVALEEAEHFALVQTRLAELGVCYGDLPVHRGLWSLAVDTGGDVLARLALVPRCMEARGLDVTPEMIRGLEREGDRESAAVLCRILDDEVGHVALGSRWFRRVCDERGLEVEATYFRLLAENLRTPPRGPFNRSLRQRAGFSPAEVDRLERGNTR